MLIYLCKSSGEALKNIDNLHPIPDILIQLVLGVVQGLKILNLPRWF